MAGEIVQTLFGVTPESYQQQQAALADQQALQYARLSPFQQANYAIGRGAYQIAGALGGEDPELQLISARNSIAKQINFSDLNSIAQGIQMLGNAGDTVGMMQLSDVYRKAQESGALVTQRQREALTPEQRNSDAYAKQFGAPGSPEYQTAFKQRFDALTLKPEDKAPPTSNEMKNAAAIASASPYPPGSDEWNALYLKELKRLTDKEKAVTFGTDREAIAMAEFGKPFAQLEQAQQSFVNSKVQKTAAGVSFGTDANRISLEMFDKPFGELTQSQRAAVNKRVDAEKQSSATKVSVNLADPTAVARANLDVMNRWEGYSKQDVETAGRFKSLQASVALAQSGNPNADGATIYNIAKIYDPLGAVQEGDKNTILGNPSIPQKVKILAQRVFEGGSLTPEQRNDILSIGTAIVKNKSESLQKYRKQYINKNKALGGTEEDIINPYENITFPSDVNPASLIPTDQNQNQRVGPAIPAAVLPSATPAQAPAKKATGKSGAVNWKDL